MDFRLKKQVIDSKIPYGKRLLPHSVDESAKVNPDRIVCKIPKSVDVSKGFLEITIEQVSKAVDHLAYWLEEKLEKKNGQQLPIAYLGAADIRYWIITLAAIKVGSPILLPSLKNSVGNNEALFNGTKCRNVFFSSKYEHQVNELASAMDNKLRFFEIPEWSDIAIQNSKRYIYSDTWETAANKPIMIMHTSGSTGNPKPITFNHAFVNMMDTARLVPDVDGREPTGPMMLEQEPGSEYYSGFPFFHMAGLAFYFQPIWYDVILVLGPVDVPANGKVMIDLMKHAKLTCIASPPSLFEDITKEYKDDFEKHHKNTKIFIYGGGPLPPFAGDYLSKRIPVMAQIMGSTEAGYLPLVSKEPEYWQWFYFHPTVGGIYFEQSEDPDLYEMVIKREPGQECHQAVFQTFPDIKEWRTKDHYKPHPTKNNYWHYVGRVDDMLVLSNGEKFNPIGMETTVSEHPAVRSSLVVGQARFQCAMIIELRDDIQYEPKVLNDIWPVIEKANKDSPAHAQISRDLVILADPTKPFARASKGTVQRWKATREYTSEIDALYEDFASSGPEINGPQAELFSTTNAAAVQEFLENIIVQILPGREIKETDDLFVLGLDSLRTSQLSSSIRNALKDHIEAAKDISTRFIYENPSIGQLKAAIIALTTGTSVRSESVTEKMRAMVEEYTSDLPAKSSKKEISSDSKVNVVVTGTTGSLVFYIILALLANPKFGKIYCLDRSAVAEEKFAERWAVLGEENLTPAPGRMHFYQTKFGHPTFGLSDSQYSELVDNVNIIIHNAWKVNFNHPLSTFTSQIESVKAFAHLSLTSPLQPTLFFVSSIAATRSYSQLVPERVLTDYTTLGHMGYGQSKYVGERILETAARRFDANMTIFRVGQIGGPVLRGLKGKWNMQEWFPSLVKTSGELGAVPKTLGGMDTIDWIPVDILGRVMVELIQLPPNNPRADGARVYNMTNPHLSNFGKLIPSIQHYYAEKGKNIEVVTFDEWLAKIAALGEDEETLERCPSKKIEDFYTGIKEENGFGGGFSTDKLVRDSDSIKTISPVNSEWINTWLGQWAY